MELLWSFSTRGGVDSSPAVVDGIIYIGSNDDSIYALGVMSSTSPSPVFSSNLFIVIGAVVSVVIVFMIAFLIFRKKPKNKQ